MKKIFKSLAMTALAVTLTAGSTVEAYAAQITEKYFSTYQEIAKENAADSSAVAGFAKLYENYLNNTKKSGANEASTKLLADQFEIPANVAVAKVVDSCNIREKAGTNYNIIGIFEKNAICEVLDVTDDGWAHIKSGSVNGYIKTDYLYMGEEGYAKACEMAHLTATVTAGTVNVRREPSTASEDTIIMEVTRGERLEVLEESVLNKNDKVQLWVKVAVDDNDASNEEGVGYVSAEFVEVGFNWKTAVKIDPIDASVSSIRYKLVNEAKKHLGLKYVWGGMSLTSGADCSGFCLAVYKKCGININKIPRTSYDLAASSKGKTVSLSNAKPGDLVFYGDKSGHVNHVALYIGNNQVIHESGRKDGCKISKVNYRTIIKIKNFVDYIY